MLQVVAAVVTFAVLTAIYATMKDHDNKECPYCGTHYRTYVRGEVWHCRYCLHQYVIRNGKAQAIDEPMATPTEGIGDHQYKAKKEDGHEDK